MTDLSTLTERDLDLIEIALQAAADGVQAGATLRNRADLDPLAGEYLGALDRVETARKPRAIAANDHVTVKGLLDEWRVIVVGGHQARIERALPSVLTGQPPTYSLVQTTADLVHLTSTGAAHHPVDGARCTACNLH